MSAEPPNEPRPLTVREVHSEFEKLLGDRRHMGMRNLIGDTLLDPRNPFQRSRRNAKRWVVAACGIALLAMLIFSYVHFR